MTLYWEKENQEAWNHTQTLSDEILLRLTADILNASDIDLDDRYIVETFLKRNNLEYNLPEAYTMEEQLDFGAHEEDLMKAED